MGLREDLQKKERERDNLEDQIEKIENQMNNPKLGKKEFAELDKKHENALKQSVGVVNECIKIREKIIEENRQIYKLQ